MDMRHAYPARAALLVFFLLSLGHRSQAQSSYWGLDAAPPELAAYGFSYGIRILDDESATWYLAEYDPYPTDPNPADAAVVALHKGDAGSAFIAVEAVQVSDANGATVPGRRLAAAETARFNDSLFPALASAFPRLSGAIRLTHLIYASDRHFQPTRFYRERQESTRNPHEEALLELLWQRDSADQDFAPFARLQAGIPATDLYATITEATREREPTMLAASAPATPPGATPQIAASPAQTSNFDNPFFEARYCAYTAGAFNDDELTKRWYEVAKLHSAGMADDLTTELDDLAFDLAPLDTLDGDARTEYEHCQTRLLSASAEATTEALEAVIASAAQMEAEARQRALNSHAPLKLDAAANLVAITTADPGVRERLRAEAHAWHAYCVVAGVSLQAMTASNPAAFGLDAAQQKHAELLAEIGNRRSLLESQFRNSFTMEEQAAARAVLEQQQSNYALGLNERGNNETAVVDYVKEQMFQCSDGLHEYWTAQAAPAATWISPTLPVERSDDFWKKLEAAMRGAQ